MSVIVKKNLSCMACDSSDARQLYDTGTSFCFSCRKWYPKMEGDDMAPDNETGFKKVEEFTSYKSPATKIAEIQSYAVRGFKERAITKEVCEFFNVRVSYGSNGEIDTHYYPYEDGKAYKIRALPKTFTWVNKSDSLFGKDKFQGGGKRVIITEGEIDALSVAQASQKKYGKIYPVVAMSSAVMTKSLLENRDWLRSFKEVVLLLDNDEAGQKAEAEAIKIIGIDKVRIGKLSEKDPNETLLKHGYERLMQAIFDAAAYVPAGIISKEKLWEALQNYNNAVSVPYPKCMDGVNAKLKGMRGGEITLFISGTGSGKSTILREIMLHLLQTTDAKFGVVSLEESPAETARKLVGAAINKNPAQEELSIDELKEGFDKTFGTDRIVLLDHQGSINDSSIIDQLEYMVLTGCKYLFIDHITILVSEGVADLTGNEAQDKIMNDLLRLVKRHPEVWIGLVSHLRKALGGKSFEEGHMPSIDDIRGSGSIKQISFDIIAFARNMIASSEREKNTIKMRILKSRFTGLTGDVAGSYYDYATGRMKALEDVAEESFVAVPKQVTSNISVTSF